MSEILLLLALAGFVIVGLGAGYTRSQPRGPVTGTWTEAVAQWTRTLAGKRLVGAAVVVTGALIVILILVLRP